MRRDGLRAAGGEKGNGITDKDEGMNTRRWIGRMAAGLAAAVLAAPASALTAEVAAEITRTLTVADERFGGCMAALSVPPSEEGLDCQTRWVTFSCTGVHASKSSAQRTFDSAQLAFFTGRSVRVWVDDEKKHNGHCFADRVDVLAPRD